MKAGLEELTRALTYAQDLGRDRWDLAVEIRFLLAAGLSPADLRWLAERGYIARAEEKFVGPDQKERVFGPPMRPAFTARSCFILTEFGQEALGRVGRTAAGKIGRALLPRWDSQRLELSLGDSLVKRFRQASPNQESVLAALERENWPRQIADPLPPRPEKERRRRLSETVRSLNRHQICRLLCFRKDLTEDTIRWEIAK